MCPLAVAVALAAAQIPPHALALYHGSFGGGPLFRFLTWGVMIWCYAALAFAIFCLWWYLPEDPVSYDEAVKASVKFFAGMRSGKL